MLRTAAVSIFACVAVLALPALVALDFSGVRFTNADILAALEAAANGHHNCYTGVGSTIVSYGNSNYHMAASGMTRRDAWHAGYYQSVRAKQLSDYERAHGYNRQGAVAA